MIKKNTLQPCTIFAVNDQLEECPIFTSIYMSGSSFVFTSKSCKRKTNDKKTCV